MAAQQKPPTYRGFVQAYLDFCRYRDKHVDLAAFYTRRYRAFCERLDLEDARAAEIASPDGGYLHFGIESTAGFALGVSSPFAGCLEAPASLSKLAGPYEARLRDLAAQQHSLCLDLLCELTVAIYGPCTYEVSRDELTQLGVGTEQAPDSVDYW